jgi:hypothetical protein
VKFEGASKNSFKMQYDECTSLLERTALHRTSESKADIPTSLQMGGVPLTNSLKLKYLRANAEAV